MLWFLGALSFLITTYVFLNYFLHSLKVGHRDRKYVLITGCDTGFGRELVLCLDKLGMPVFATCLSTQACLALAEVCSHRVKPLCLDVRHTGSITTALTEVEQWLSRGKASLWAVVNNAGIAGLCAPVEMCRTQDFLDCLDVNLFGAMEVTRHFLPLLRKSGGRVVNMGCVLGRLAPSLTSCYATSKFGIEGYSDMLRRELYRQGVHVSLIQPGFHRTPLLNHEQFQTALQAAFKRSPKEIQDTYGANYVDRMMYLHYILKEKASNNTAEVINAYVHAVSSRFPQTRYVVGQDARFFFIPMSYLPDWCTDLVLSFGHRQILKMGGFDDA